MPKPITIPRITSFDMMRGFFLIAIIFNHLNLYPNLLDWWGMRGQLLISTAEGFFLVSGVVLGIVRGAKLVHEPFKKVAQLVLKRAWTLYLTHIVLVIGFTLIGWLFYEGNPGLKYGIMGEHSFLKLVFDTVTLQYIYGWADYLRFYAIFIALSPLALWLLRHGKWYVVLGLSFLTWLVFPISASLPWEQQELLQPIPWQVIFFSGLVIGFHWPQITAWYGARKKLLVPYVVRPLIAVAILLLGINVFAVFAKEFLATPWTIELSQTAWQLLNEEFNKQRLPLVRLAFFYIVFWAAFLIVRRYEAILTKLFGWLLLPFGTNSLYVYTLHAIIIFFVHLYITNLGLIGNFIISVLVIALIYLAIRTKFLMRIIPR